MGWPDLQRTKVAGNGKKPFPSRTIPSSPFLSYCCLFRKIADTAVNISSLKIIYFHKKAPSEAPPSWLLRAPAEWQAHVCDEREITCLSFSTLDLPFLILDLNPTYLTSEPLTNVSTLKQEWGGLGTTCPLATLTALFHIRPKSSVIGIILCGYLAFCLTLRGEWLGSLRQNSPLSQM